VGGPLEEKMEKIRFSELLRSLEIVKNVFISKKIFSLHFCRIFSFKFCDRMAGKRSLFVVGTRRSKAESSPSIPCDVLVTWKSRHSTCSSPFGSVSKKLGTS
jgi:hypothetical protein